MPFFELLSYLSTLIKLNNHYIAVLMNIFVDISLFFHIVRKFLLLISTFLLYKRILYMFISKKI
mgnify:CR=1 FL=1